MENNVIPAFDKCEKRWRHRLKFVGMIWESIIEEDGLVKGYIKIPGGLCSLGLGESVGDAIRNASFGMNTNWNSVDKKITEKEWGYIAHE
jgi:hypothetical protein